MTRRTVRHGFATLARTTVICGVAAFVAGLAAVGTTGTAWAVMVLTAFALWTLTDAIRRTAGGRR